ncbi:transposable element Tcb2 transposase [Trichonephila clavipes]|uniref:Transposable element Tcb2 transposase n=1 Tax=Trichonephila clavipes TaxID=2585209 RepID=A0A8X6S904_TRICX|nr:transposable element Tcb2 transposase [Trichonephila clavipes]
MQRDCALRTAGTVRLTSFSVKYKKVTKACLRHLRQTSCREGVLPLTLTPQRLRLERCRARGSWTAVEWNQVVFIDESRFNLSSDDNRVRVGGHRGECLNPAFVLQRHTAPTAGVMVWGAIAYNTRLPLVLIRGTVTAQRYVHDILVCHVLPIMQWLPGVIFQQGNARPNTARVSQDCIHTVTTLPWPSRSTDLSPIEHIWDHLGRRELGIPRV